MKKENIKQFTLDCMGDFRAILSKDKRFYTIFTPFNNGFDGEIRLNLYPAYKDHWLLTDLGCQVKALKKAGYDVNGKEVRSHLHPSLCIDEGLIQTRVKFDGLHKALWRMIEAKLRITVMLEGM